MILTMKKNKKLGLLTKETMNTPSTHNAINEAIKFTGRNVPIIEIAKVMKKDPAFIRRAIQDNILGFGKCIKNPYSIKYNYYVSDKELYEAIGYFNNNVK